MTPKTTQPALPSVDLPPKRANRSKAEQIVDLLKESRPRDCDELVSLWRHREPEQYQRFLRIAAIGEEISSE
jgi:hypothetical protein